MGQVVIPIAGEITQNDEDVQGKYGKIYLGNSYGNKTIEVPFTIWAYNSESDYLDIITKLTDVLVDPLHPKQEYALQFGFRPNVTYWGHVSAVTNPTTLSAGTWNMSGSFTFTMSDPRGVYPRISQAMRASGVNTITVGGTAQTEPIIHIIPTKAIQYFGYTLSNNTQNGLVGVGTDNDSDETPVSKYTEVMYDDCGTLASWSSDATALSNMTTAQPVVFSGEANSSVATSSIRVKVKDHKKQYGPTVEGKFFGPALIHDGLSQPLSDFRVRTKLHHVRYQGTHNGRSIGSVEGLLLDINGRTFGRISIRDHVGGGVPYLYMQVGKPGSPFKGKDGTYQTLYYGEPKSTVKANNKKIKVLKSTTTTKKKKIKKYAKLTNKEEKNCLSNFWGEFMIEKQGNRWRWSVTQYNLDTGLPQTNYKKYLIKSGSWLDKENKFSNVKLASFGVMMMKKAITEDLVKPVVPYKNAFNTISDLRIDKVNTAPDDKITTVANPNQEIIIDTAKERITVDGKLAHPIWVSNFPKLSPGVNRIQFFGDDKADISLEYDPKIK